MKPLAILFCCPLLALAETRHNNFDENAIVSSISQRLREGGVFVTCQVRQSGRYVANANGVYGAVQWRTRCVKDLQVVWPESAVNGNPAAFYVVSYRDVLAPNAPAVQIEFDPEEPRRAFLDVSDPTRYEIFVEAVDAEGNTEYVNDVSYE